MPSTTTPPSPLLTDPEKKACIFLSDFFLDVEYDQERLDKMARVCERLHMPLSKLDHIFRYDLFPILYPNLLSVVGEWMGFDEDELLREIDRRRAAPPWFFKRFELWLLWLALGSMVTGPWEYIKARVRHNKRL